MRFHNKELNYGSINQPDVIELSTPPIEMYTILKSFVGSEDTTEVKRELAELEHEGRIESIARLYEDIDDGSERDTEINEIIYDFSVTLDSLHDIDDYTAREALQAVRAESEQAKAMKDKVVSLRSPLVGINTLVHEISAKNKTSLPKRQLIYREYETVKELLINYEDDFDTSQTLVDSFKTTIRDIIALSEEMALHLASQPSVESIAVSKEVEQEDYIADIIPIQSARHNNIKIL